MVGAYQHTLLNHRHTHRANAAPVTISRFKIYGNEIHWGKGNQMPLQFVLPPLVLRLLSHKFSS
jgi:hypothetical protein